MKTPPRTRLPLCAVALALLATAGCASPRASQSAGGPGGVRSESVWAVDFIQTLPGQRERYLRFNELNWVPARHAFVRAGIARSFRALVAPPDSARGWDVVLMTEYVDAAALARAEEVFRAFRAQPGNEVRLVDGLGARDLARIVGSHDLQDVTVGR